jgi:hypothetical protein
MGLVGFTALIDLTLAWLVYRSWTRIRDDAETDPDRLRAWFELRYGTRAVSESRDLVEGVIRRETRAKRWRPVIAVVGTVVLVALAAVSLAVVFASELGLYSPAPWRLLSLLLDRSRVQLALFAVLALVTLAEQVALIRNSAEFDIRRLNRLARSLE